MKRIQRNPERFEVMDLFRALARENDLRLDDPAAIGRFLDVVGRGLATNQESPITLHGLRIEGMFEHVAAGLGNTVLIRREDAGDICSTEPDIRPSDFRLVLESGLHILVEVKNCHEERPDHRLVLREPYVGSLERYAAILGNDLYIAIYWSRWEVWTLNTIPDFERTRRTSISFIEAVTKNRMTMLGDIHVATTPPLALRIVADDTKPRTIDETGHCMFTISKMELTCAGKKIVDRAEAGLALYFMLNSRWPIRQSDPSIVDGELSHIEFVAMPDEIHSEQGFDILGALSTMISKGYNEKTSEAGVIQRLAPLAEPGTLGVLIPKNYRGVDLPLWQFHIEPNTSAKMGGAIEKASR